MLKRKYMIIVLATASVLLGSMVYNMGTQAYQVGEYDPWIDLNDDGWIDIFDLVLLASRYGSSGTPINKTALLLDLLNRVEALETRVSELEKKPQIITVTGHPNFTQLISGVITDLLYIPNVTVPEGANVLAIANGYFRCSDIAQNPFALRYRANSTYGEWLQQGSPLANVSEIVEIHYTWTNLTVGTYSFAVQYYVNPIREVYVHRSRFTLIIF